MKTTTLLYPKNLLTGNVIINCLLFWLAILAAISGLSFLTTFLPRSGRPIALGILGIIAALAITYYFLKRENKQFTDIGFAWNNKTIVKFIGGYLTGSIIISFMLICLVLFANLTIKPNTSDIDWISMLWASVAFLLLSFMEEVVFRSYPFERLKSTYGLRIAFFTTVIAFALWHLLSGMHIISCFLGPGIWAFVFGLAAHWSGGISFATGLHVALNLMQGFFGMKGNMQHIWKLVPAQSPEGAVSASSDTIGLILQVVILVLSIVLMEWTIRKKRDIA